MPSKTQTRVDIPLNAAISIDVCIICGRPQPEIWDTAHGRNLLHECTRVPVPLTLSIPRTRTQVPMRGDFRRVENVRFFAPGNFLTHFTILSFPIHSNFSFKCIVQTIDVFVNSLIYHSSDFITFIYAL